MSISDNNRYSGQEASDFNQGPARWPIHRIADLYGSLMRFSARPSRIHTPAMTPLRPKRGQATACRFEQQLLHSGMCHETNRTSVYQLDHRPDRKEQPWRLGRPGTEWSLWRPLHQSRRSSALCAVRERLSSRSHRRSAERD